jgi:hypothetical protein
MAVGSRSVQAGSAATRLLAVLLEPDERPGTQQWRTVLDALGKRTDAQGRIWFLRDRRDERWADAGNVDDLRTWWPNQALGAVGLGLAGSWLRGRRLRRRFVEAAPAVIVLDAGWGQRIVGAAGPSPVVAVRDNPWAPTVDDDEDRHPEVGQIVLGEHPDGADGDPTEGARPRVHWSPYLTEVASWQADLAGERAQQRASLGLPADALVVVGWGEDGWVDGSDLFVRTLWYLSDRHGIEAHGVWIAPLDDDTEVDRLRGEAERCGLEDRLHLVAPDAGIDLRCGDVVHLPRRVPLEWHIPATCAACDLTLVTCAEVPFPARWIRSVPLLDLPGAAVELHRALAEGAARWAAEVDPDGVIDRLHAAVSAVRVR